MCRAQDSPAPHVAALPARRLGAHQELGQLTPAAPKMSHTTGHCAQRYQPDERVGGCSKWWCLSSQCTVTRDGPRFPGSSLIPCFALLAVFALPRKMSQSHEFSHFYFSSALPCLSQGEWASCRVVLSCLLGFSYSTPQVLFTDPSNTFSNQNYATGAP